jgi:hypothetical protein
MSRGIYQNTTQSLLWIIDALKATQASYQQKIAERQLITLKEHMHTEGRDVDNSYYDLRFIDNLYNRLNIKHQATIHENASNTETAANVIKTQSPASSTEQTKKPAQENTAAASPPLSSKKHPSGSTKPQINNEPSKEAEIIISQDVTLKMLKTVLLYKRVFKGGLWTSWGSAEDKIINAIKKYELSSDQLEKGGEIINKHETLSKAIREIASVKLCKGKKENNVDPLYRALYEWSKNKPTFQSRQKNLKEIEDYCIKEIAKTPRCDEITSKLFGGYTNKQKSEEADNFLNINFNNQKTINSSHPKDSHAIESITAIASTRSLDDASKKSIIEKFSKARTQPQSSKCNYISKVWMKLTLFSKKNTSVDSTYQALPTRST